MKFPELTGARAAVIGLGKSGLSSCRLLKNKGAKVFGSDSGPLRGEVLEELKNSGLDFEMGGHTERCWQGKDFLIVSPGVPLNAAPLLEAKKRGVPVYSEIELGFWFTSSPIVAITGTNGKTTTTTLIGELLKSIGKKAAVCGNVGLPFCEVVMAEERVEVIVMEVSSFQLESIKYFRPHIGILLNITPNHLDRYAGDISAYGRAKARLFMNQDKGDTAILNADDEIVRRVSMAPAVKQIFFSINGESQMSQLRLCKERLVSYLEPIAEELISCSLLKLPGRHNMANALAVCAGMLTLFPQERGWLKALAQFRGLPHRLEVIRTIRQVTFINDSKATSIDATVKAIDSLPGKIILIAGGRDKDSPFELLKKAVSAKVREAVLIGEAGEKIARALDGATKITLAVTFKEAVILAFKKASPGEYVLLSPACASFDMFNSFEERGEVFKEIVLNLI